MNRPIPAANAVLEVWADGVKYFLTDTEERKGEKDHPRDKDATESDLPGVGVTGGGGGGNGGEDEKEVLAHARRLGDRIARDQRHDGRGQRGGEAGGGHDRAEIHPGRFAGHRAGKGGRVHDDDIGHGHERRDAGEDLGARVRLVLRQLEESSSTGRLRIKRRN